MLIKAVVDPIESKEASNTVTLIPSKPSLASSVFAVTSKVVDVEPADNVTVPDNATKSADVALSTVAPLSSPTFSRTLLFRCTRQLSSFGSHSHRLVKTQKK